MQLLHPYQLLLLQQRAVAMQWEPSALALLCCDPTYAIAIASRLQHRRIEDMPVMHRFWHE